MSGLLLNCFPVEVQPTVLNLPAFTFSSWDEARAARDERFRGFSTYRLQAPERNIRLVLLSGPEITGERQSWELDVGFHPTVGTRFIEQALSDHLNKLGLDVSGNRFEKLAVRQDPSFTQNVISLHTGVSFKARRPFAAEPHQFALSVQWEAKAFFSKSLSDAGLRGISVGLGVLYRPSGPAPKELEPYAGRFLGRVTEVDNDLAVVSCRDHAVRSLPVHQLYLEARPEAIRQYESRAGRRPDGSIWRRIQQLSLALRNDGRRNESMSRDRLDQIRSLLSAGMTQQLTLPVRSYADCAVTIGLSPIRVESEEKW
jgi:hypothetical protein